MRLSWCCGTLLRQLLQKIGTGRNHRPRGGLTGQRPAGRTRNRRTGRRRAWRHCRRRRMGSAGAGRQRGTRARCGALARGGPLYDRRAARLRGCSGKRLPRPGKDLARPGRSRHRSRRRWRRTPGCRRRNRRLDRRGGFRSDRSWSRRLRRRFLLGCRRRGWHSGRGRSDRFGPDRSRRNRGWGSRNWWSLDWGRGTYERRAERATPDGRPQRMRRAWSRHLRCH